MKPEEFEKEVCEGEIGPLYYFYGDEPYLVERGVKRLLARAVSPEFREFNLTVFYGGEAKGPEIVEAAQTLPMFAERRVVLVKKSGALSAAALDVLAGYVQDPAPSSCLIFQGEKIDQRKKFFLDMKKNGKMVEYKRPYENQLGFFIREEAAVFDKRLEPAAVEMLAYFVGNNLQELAAQVEKVAIYIGARQTIKVDDVRAIASDTKVESVFDLSNALGEKNLGRALRSLQTILRDGEAPLMVLAMVTRHFRQLWRVKELLGERVTPQEISKAAGIHPYFIRGVMEQAGGFSRADFIALFERFYATDLALKTSGGRPLDLLERLVMDICAKGK
ncbi:MAG TPA: DNA polymerase III subunit delta [Geobacteraceae bacterium]